MSNNASAAAQTQSPPAANPNARVYRGVWSDVRQLNEDTFLYRVRLELGPNERALSFAPGQFVQIYRNADPKDRSRAYSVASVPVQLPELELCIKLYPAGLLSEYLRTIKPGMPITLKAPFGRFMLRADDAAADVPRVFVVTGTGVAPVRSMIHALLAANAAAHVTLIQGHRSENGIFFRDEFERLAAKHGNFTYLPTVSPRYVTHVLRSLMLAPETRYYLCGNPAMVREASVQLLERSIAVKQIAVEKW
jgi:ferredoxin-NADP reductase